MTDQATKLAALDTKATQGVWEVDSRKGWICTKPALLTTYVIAEMQSSNEANEAFIVALVNAYRANALVPTADLDEAVGEAKHYREILHEIHIEAMHTIPPDGGDAAFQALERIGRLIVPFLARHTQEAERG